MPNVAKFILYAATVAAITTGLYHVIHKDQVRLSEAHRLFRNGKYAEAEKRLESLVDTDTFNGADYRVLGLCRMRKGHHKEALQAFERYLASGDFKASDLQTLLGLYQANGKWEKALRLTESLLEKHPDDRTLRFTYARILTATDQFRKASKQYRIILGEYNNGT
mgnify:CR=1 FL=1